jgi:Fe-S cluster assembly protein SufD
MSAALGQRILEEFGALGEDLPSGVVPRERRREALERLIARGLPSTREENWRYANLRPLERARFAPVPASEARDPMALPPPLEGFARYTFVDGRFVPELSATAEHAAVSVRNLGSRAGIAHLPRAPGAAGELPEARLALINEAFAPDAACVHVRGGEHPPVRIELLFIAASEPSAGTSYPRIEIGLEPGARLSLLEQHLSAGAEASIVNSSVRVELARGAQLEHLRLQRLGARAAWFDTLTAVLAEEARYALRVVSAGAASARSSVHVRLAGAAAELVHSAATLGERQQVQDTFALAEHLAPRTRTEQTFRGIAAGRARIAFNGKVTVRAGAPGTDSRQSLRGLLAGAEAEIDLRPQLEIYTDEVRCSHGATAGKLDETMLFYLLSRGLGPEVAQRLLKWAFLEDVIAKIGPPELRRRLERDLAGQMSEGGALEELL